MKLCQLNIQKDNALYQPYETDEHFNSRRTILVEDDYDFNGNGDMDMSEDACCWEKHYSRLGVNYFHFLKTIQRIITNKCAAAHYSLITSEEIEGSLLTDEEKLVGTVHHVLPYVFRVLTAGNHQVTNDQDADNWKTLIYLSKEAREFIVEDVREAVADYLRTGGIGFEQSQRFFMITDDYIEAYENAASPVFYSYMTSSSITVDGQIFDFTSGNGFIGETFGTQVILDKVLSIYNNPY